MTTLDLSLISPSLRERAREALTQRDIVGFLSYAPSHVAVELVFRNHDALRQHELLESAIVSAVTSTNTNNRRFYVFVELLVQLADKARLRAAGDPMPGSGPWLLYRGVAGTGAARHVRGFSWTSDKSRAKWFAARAVIRWQLPSPAVYAATVPDKHVLFYSNERDEAEFFVSLPREFPLQRLRERIDLDAAALVSYRPTVTPNDVTSLLTD